MAIVEKITSLFPLWAIIFSVTAYMAPDFFSTLKPGIAPLLGVVMFGMGMTLTMSDFLAVARRPGIVASGTLMQYCLMPFFAWAVSSAFGLPPYLAAGMVIVGSCPGGTASNLICYLSRGDVALSITLTFVSTMLAVVLTPVLTWVYIGKSVPVPVFGMILTVLKIVIIPVALGIAANTLWGARLGEVKKVFPLVSALAIVLIIAIIIAINRENFSSLAPSLALCVILHNTLGLAGGYWIARALGAGEKTSRTLAIEVGMQNSGLGVALAVKYFSAAAALPGAIFSVWHNLSGSALASWWSRRI